MPYLTIYLNHDISEECHKEILEYVDNELIRNPDFNGADVCYEYYAAHTQIICEDDTASNIRLFNGINQIIDEHK